MASESDNLKLHDRACPACGVALHANLLSCPACDEMIDEDLARAVGASIVPSPEYNICPRCEGMVHNSLRKCTQCYALMEQTFTALEVEAYKRGIQRRSRLTSIRVERTKKKALACICVALAAEGYACCGSMQARFGRIASW
jgi:hypothetical protein